jgi:hypothetical protein
MFFQENKRYKRGECSRDVPKKTKMVDIKKRRAQTQQPKPRNVVSK